MSQFTRRSVLRSSASLLAAGILARPYIANAAATTAEVWWIQGFVPEEDVAYKKIVADYEKASGNKIDYSIMPFAPLRQKIVSAVTSGVVPDLYQSTPTELIADPKNSEALKYKVTACPRAFVYDNKGALRYTNNRSDDSPPKGSPALVVARAVDGLKAASNRDRSKEPRRGKH